MTTEVDKYRGYEIRFNTTDETFECDIDDSRSVKKSYSAIKKFIDDFIKENSEFKPFKVMPTHNGWKTKGGFIIGIRKNGNFILKSDEGESSVVSKYNEKDYMLPNPDNEPIFLVIDELEEQVTSLRKQIKEQEKNLKVVTLKDIKPKYIQQ